jgi:hypothetical protein
VVAFYKKAFTIMFFSEFSATLSGTDVMILKIFSPKNSAKLAFLTQNKA